MAELHAFTLNNGIKIPVVGLGVYQMPNDESTQKAISFALNNGYRHIDTAKIYGNERAVGNAVISSGIPREEIFITTKVWNSDQGYDQTIKAFNESMQRLNVTYLDLYLIHWPVQGKRKDTWKALETIYREGKCRAIGVSNYMKHHLEELFGYCNIFPAANQLELHPFIYGDRTDTVHFCQNNNILPIAYSPLTKGLKLKEPLLLRMAEYYGKTTAQLLIRWAIQHNFAVIPKSSLPSRISQNNQVFDFEINNEDMTKLDNLHQGLATGWDPTDAL